MYVWAGISAKEGAAATAALAGTAAAALALAADKGKAADEVPADKSSLEAKLSEASAGLPEGASTGISAAGKKADAAAAAGLSTAGAKLAEGKAPAADAADGAAAKAADIEAKLKGVTLGEGSGLAPGSALEKGAGEASIGKASAAGDAGLTALSGLLAKGKAEAGKVTPEGLAVEQTSALTSESSAAGAGGCKVSACRSRFMHRLSSVPGFGNQRTQSDRNVV